MNEAREATQRLRHRTRRVERATLDAERGPDVSEVADYELRRELRVPAHSRPKPIAKPIE